jgi:hypothetical protein
MGYRISLEDVKFRIRADRKADALAAAKQLKSVEQKVGNGGNGTIRWFSWMNGVDLSEIQTLEEMLESWRYETVIDADGNVVDLSFLGEKIGQEDLLWQAIAPFVEPGSFIEMSGEDGAHWRWIFDGETCQEQKAKISWS